MITGILFVVIGLAVIVLSRIAGLPYSALRLANFVGAVLALVGLVIIVLAAVGYVGGATESESAPRTYVFGEQ